MLFAIQGLFRGLLAQVLGLTGLIVGIWAGAGIRQWVGAQWLGAQPAVVFWALRWLVTLLGALAVISLFQVLGERLRHAAHESPIGGLDRFGGFLLGAVTGVALASVFVLASVRAPSPRWVREGVRTSRAARPLLECGADVCRWAGNFPGGPALRRQYLLAARTLERRIPAI